MTTSRHVLALTLVLTFASSTTTFADDATVGDIRVDAARPRRQWKPLVAELTGIMAAGQLWYFRHGADGNADDWDMPLSFRSLGAKLTGEAWSFDDNGFVTNSVKHPMLFGAPVHALARLHGFSFAESFAISTGMSLLWETGGELREFASINDLLSTSTGGLPIGEAVYQVLKHPRAARWELRAGAQALDSTVYQHVGARVELDTLTRPGKFSGGRQVKLAVDRPFDAKGTRAWEVDARTTLAGRLFPNGVLLGAFAAFDYVHKMKRTDLLGYDTFANTVAGPTASYSLARRGVRLRATLDVGLDFAMLKPQAFAAWRAANPDEVVRGALEDNQHRYYYAFGTTIEPRVELALHGFTIGGRVRAGYFNSIEGRDRWKDQMTTDIHLEDTRTRATAWLGYELRGAALTIEAERDSRWGRVEAISSQIAQRKLTGSLAFRF